MVDITSLFHNTWVKAQGQAVSSIGICSFNIQSHLHMLYLIVTGAIQNVGNQTKETKVATPLLYAHPQFVWKNRKKLLYW